jgi:AraC family carnitine catabolism transcriptional activator
MANASDAVPERISFLLVPNFSMMAFMSAVEPLRVANRFGERELFSWRVLSSDGQPVTASNGMRVLADAAVADVERVSMLFVCASFDPERYADHALFVWLRRMAAYGSLLGAIDTGCFILARAGLLDGYRVTLHWESVGSFVEAFPAIQVSEELFEVDRNRFTCAGGTAALDMMLHLIARRHGQELAVAISEQFIHDRIRDRSDHQRMTLCARLGIHNAHVLRVVALMEKHIETPLPLEALAQEAGVSLRQLERLFACHLGETPRGYYLGLRLNCARRLLQQTSMQVIAVALACGFTSAAPLSRAYKTRFGCSPREDRCALPRSPVP